MSSRLFLDTLCQTGTWHGIRGGGVAQVLMHKTKPRFLLFLILVPKHSCFPQLNLKTALRWERHSVTRIPLRNTALWPHRWEGSNEIGCRLADVSWCCSALTRPREESSYLRAELWRGTSHSMYKQPLSAQLSSLHLGSKSLVLWK